MTKCSEKRRENLTVIFPRNRIMANVEDLMTLKS